MIILLKIFKLLLAITAIVEFIIIGILLLRIKIDSNL